MSSYRYQNTPIERDSNGKRFFPTNLYNQVDPQADDIYLITDKGDRLDNLAYEYYGDPSLWWVLSSANDIPRDSIFIPVGSQIRVPANITSYLEKYDRENQKR